MMTEYVGKITQLEQIEKDIEETGMLSENHLYQLKEYACDPDEGIRATVAKMLVEEAQAGEEILIFLARDSDSLVRAEAYDSIRYSKSFSTFSFLEKAIKKERNGMARGYAQFAYGYVGKAIGLGTEARRFLSSQLLIEKTVFARISLLHILNVLGEQDALDDLLVLLNTRVYQNRCAVLNALDDLLSGDNAKIILNAIDMRLSIENVEAVISGIHELQGKCRKVLLQE